MDASGNFVVAWESEGQDGSLHGVYARLGVDWSRVRIVPEPTVDMKILEVDVDLEDGGFSIEDMLDVMDTDFERLVLDPQLGISLQLQTGGTSEAPQFGIASEGQVPLTTRTPWNWRELQYGGDGDDDDDDDDEDDDD